MKTRTTRLIVPIIGLGLVTLNALNAQETGTGPNVAATNATCPGGSCHGGWKHLGNHGAPANLTPAEGQEFKAAMEQIKDNPQLQAAREAAKQARETLRQTRDQLLLQADPKLQPILEKMHASEPAPAPSAN